MSKTKKIAILAIIAMVLTMLPVSLFAATADDTRLAGADRIETALEIASAGTWGNTVVLAPADQANLVDSLAAAPLAGQENAPILLTFKGSLDAGVKARIAALGANKVYVIGAISDAVKDEVDAIDGVSVEKLAGADRWATAAAINAKLVNPAGTFVVGYNAIPDALSVASFAAANKYAIVLANADGTVPADKLVGDKTYLVGGTAVVKDYNGATRLGGADRYATNKAVVEGLSFNFDRVYVANGLSMVDALAASSLAAKYNAPVLLSNGSSVPAGDAVKDKLGMVIALGGTSAVSDAVIDSLTGELGNIVNCAVVAKSYDDDTKNQYVEFTVNGKKVTVEALNALGWDLEFTAGDSKTNPAADSITENLFVDTTTGLLSSDLIGDEGDYWVQLTLTMGSDVVISNATKITIKNLNLAATAVSDYTLKNDANGIDGLGSEFTMKSTKLVIGETATFEDITVTAGSAKEDITWNSVDKQYSLKTSDAGVISKGSGDNANQITAETPGTASITVTYGKATKTISFTVVDDAREAKKVEIKKTSDGAVITSLKTYTDVGLQVKVIDQYGDPLEGADLAAKVSNYDVLDGATETIVANKLTVTTNDSGSATITFTSDGIKIGAITVTVVTDGDVAKKTLELYKIDTNQKRDGMRTDLGDADLEKDNFSTDTTLDKADDNLLVYHVKNFNADGVFVGYDKLSFVDVVESKSGVVTASTVDIVATSADDSRIVIEAGETGTATVKFKDSSDKLYTVKVTVVNNDYSIKSISLKTPVASDYVKTYNYKSVLNYTSTGSHPIVTGITLSKAAAQEIRFDTGKYEFYIDKNSNGANDDDAVVGYLVLSGTGNITVSDGQEYTTGAGDDGTIIFKVFNIDDKIVASKSVTVEL